MRYSDSVDEELPIRLKTPLKCRRERYEVEINGSSYCGTDDECIYKKKEMLGYRCLMLDKQI